MKVFCPTVRFDIMCEFGGDTPSAVAAHRFPPAHLDTLRIEMPPESRGTNPDQGRIACLLAHAMSPNEPGYVLGELSRRGVEVVEDCDFTTQHGTRYSGTATLTCQVSAERFYAALIEEVRVMLEDFFRVNLAPQKGKKQPA